MMLLFVAAGATVASAQEWRKLGEKDVNFNVDHENIVASDKGRIREIHLKVLYGSHHAPTGGHQR